MNSKILSKQRASRNWSRDVFENYLHNLTINTQKVHVNLDPAFLAKDWYSLSLDSAPHDASLKGLEILDDWDEGEININLSIRKAAKILKIIYSSVQAYKIDAVVDCSGIHGGWLYDEVQLDSEGIMHLIEWGNGPIWSIKCRSISVLRE